jgi:hypothetical protein
MCAEKQEDCLLLSTTCSSLSSKPYQCKNLSCVASPQECAKNPALVIPLTLEYDLKSIEAVTIDFAFTNNYSVGRLVLPSDPVASSTASSTGYHKLRFEPVPTSELNAVENFVNTEFYDTISPYFNMNESTG